MNSGTTFGEYIRLCSRRFPIMFGLMGGIFVIIFLYMIITTPTKYVMQGKIRLESVQQVSSIADQSDLANLSAAAANTTIGLIENSDTVGLALQAAHMENDIDAGLFAAERVNAEAINNSEIIEVTVTFDDSAEQATIFTYNLLQQACTEISNTVYSGGTKFVGNIIEDGRQIDRQSAWVPSLLYATYGALITMALFLFVQLLSVLTDKTLRSNEKFDKITKLPVIASIPTFSRLTGPNSDRSGARVSNSYRVLRSAIKYSTDKVRSVAVCSPQARDGRTSVAIGLATALAETDAMVLLIEADMRKPSVSMDMHVESTYGLADLLLGKTNLASTICKTSNRNLYVITGINNTNLSNVNISDLLDSSVFDELLEAVQGQFDYVIIDTPSVEIAPDCTSIIGKVDCSVAVAQYGHTKVDSIKAALDIFNASGSTILGIVTTNTPQHAGVFASLSSYGKRGSGGRKSRGTNPINEVFSGGSAIK